METTILRKANEADKQFFDVDLNKPVRQKSTDEKFTIELFKREAMAHSKKLPFARNAARDEFKDSLELQKKMVQRGATHKVTLPAVDWKKYSDIKNFDLIDTKERPDPEMSKHNPGLNVKLITKIYKWKQSKERCSIMEDPEDALRRAQEKVAKSRS